MVSRALQDGGMVARAIVANLAARFVPSLYFRSADLTGRGLDDAESVRQVADYYFRCFDDYFVRLGVASPPDFLAGKVVLEYGPGDFPGVALLMIASGAERAVCVDRFPLVKASEKNLQILALMAERLPPAQAERLRGCLVDPARPASGLDERKVRYVVGPSGLSGLDNEVDLAFSRAVLEHVNDLPATFDDMVRALRDGGHAVHQVDLRSHGNHRVNPLDFLRWSPWLWQWMHSAKGAPNRYRVDSYRRIVAALAVDQVVIESTQDMPLETVRDVRPQLAPVFASLSDADLACVGFWVAFRRRARSG